MIDREMQIGMLILVVQARAMYDLVEDYGSDGALFVFDE